MRLRMTLVGLFFSLSLLSGAAHAQLDPADEPLPDEPIGCGGSVNEARISCENVCERDDTRLVFPYACREYRSGYRTYSCCYCECVDLGEVLPEDPPAR